MIALALVACAAPSPEVLLEPDAARTGADGTDGPLGAESVEFRVQARVTERVRVEAVVPLADDAAPAPTVVFVQGGLVDAARYRWLAIHLASRGYAVLMPDYALDLAIQQSGNADAAWVGATTNPPTSLVGAFDPERRVGGGHSLGGVVAAMNWTQDDGWDGLFLAASFPAEGTAVEDDPRPVLSLIGSDDGSADGGATQAGAERFAGPVFFGVVDGMNHYGWTDDATEKELAKDGTATRPVDEARRDALRVFDTWLDATLRDDPTALEALDGAFPNVERP